MKIKPILIILSLIYVCALTACGGAGMNDISPESDLRMFADHTWRLNAYGPLGEISPVLPQPQITLRFDFDNQVASGSAGCNSYSAKFSLKGAQLTLEQAMSTLMACLDDQAMQQETEYILLLSRVTHYQLEGGSLSLFTDRGEVLQFLLSE